MITDPLAAGHIMRAERAINDALAGLSRPATIEQKAAAFTQGAFAIMANPNSAVVGQVLEHHPDPLVAKAAPHMLVDNIWGSGPVTELAAAFIASISELSILDQLIAYGRSIPVGIDRALIASGATGDLVGEGEPKIVRRLDLSAASAEPTKAVGLVVLSAELVRAGGDAVMAMFQRELTAAVTRAVNRTILSRVVDTNAIAVASTGSAIGDLRAGLAAASPADGFVVTAPGGTVAALATDAGSRGGMGVRGGTFIDGVSIIAVDGETDMTIIPASRFAVRDHGLIAKSAGHATVDLRDSPAGDPVLTSLWQNNLLGLLVERSYDLVPGGDPAVVVGGTP